MTIDLTELFKVQNVLKERIGYKEPDHFDKLKLALLVELGECANEWRGFKFWSTNQKPNTSKPVNTFHGSRNGDTTNPLLEEYVDGLHFVMELGLVIHSSFRVPYERINIGLGSITDKFNAIYLLASKLEEGLVLLNDEYYRFLLTEYVELAEYLGFTWDQVEKAYYEKNKINHKRQENGY